MYPVIQRTGSANVLQGLKAAKRTGEEKVLNINQTALTVLPREHAPARGKRPRHFLRFVFLPVALAYER